MAAKTTNDVKDSDIKNIATVFASLVTVEDGSRLSGVGIPCDSKEMVTRVDQK